MPVMKFILSTASFALGATAASLPRDSCCFPLSASGGRSGTVGQLSDGQNRIGGDNPAGSYCIGSDGGITDGQGRGCILTPPTSQFQCDEGATPTTGFSVGSNGQLQSNGNGKFYACPASDNVYNIYTSPVQGQQQCVEITLSTGGQCASGQPAQSSQYPSQPAPSAPASYPAPAPSQPAHQPQSATQETTKAATYPQSGPSTLTSQITQTVTLSSASKESYTEAPKSSPYPSQPSKACPTNLSGPYQFPHQIVPINSDSPSSTYGTSYNGQINSTTSSIFTFDIPQSYEGQKCSLIFLLPNKKDLETSDFTLTGSGEVVFSQLSEAATGDVSYKSAPQVSEKLNSISVQPGNGYVVATSECKPGTAQSYELSSTGGLGLEFFEDYNPSPIGLYITTC